MHREPLPVSADVVPRAPSILRARGHLAPTCTVSVVSLLYRALWQADAEALIETAHREFCSWVSSKDSRLEVPDNGDFEVPGADVRVVEGTDGEQGDIKRWVLHEDDEHKRWITTMTAVRARGEPEGWLWIDLENVSKNYLERADVAAPRLARSLLDALPSSHRGPVKLQSSEHKLGPGRMAAFVAQLEHPERDLPLIVFSPDHRASAEVSIQRAQRATRALSGLCQVHLLVPQGEEEFRDTLGSELGVWAGACRVYLPNISLVAPDPRRHRYFLARNLGRRPGDAGLRISRYLSPLVTRQRAPLAYVKLRHLLDADYQAQIDELWAEWNLQTEQNEQMEGQLRETEDSYIDALTEVEDLNDLQAHVQRNLRDLWRAIDAADVRSRVASHLRDEIPKDGSAVLGLPESCAEAAELARQQLKDISLPEAACRDLDRLDQAIEAAVWAKTAWRGLVALNSYAQSAVPGTGGFHQWCSSSIGEATWSASSKKLAMVESDSVRQHEKLRDARILPVDSRVNRSGRVFMEAHLKISQGGGSLAPRIYFYDDTAGSTGKVHVGYFGPHYHMPNKQTN